MDKELTDKAPAFAKLVDEVARTMETCGDPNKTYSMMDEYEDAQEKARCYVNPFVGEGRYAKYLRMWLEVVPSSQLMILNFDEWTAGKEARKFRTLRMPCFPSEPHHAALLPTCSPCQIFDCACAQMPNAP